MHGLSVLVIGDPVPAEDIETGGASFAEAVAIPFVVQYAGFAVTGGVELYFFDGSIFIR